MIYYVCDGCGNIVTIESAPIPDDAEWECDRCGAHALWEFTSRRNALAMMRQIEDVNRSGLFKRARP